MKKLFLVSAFIPVAELFIEFVNQDIKGKKISFITTASMPKKSKFYVKWAKDKLTSFGLEVIEVEISSMSYEEVAHQLETNDFIYVCGGNPLYLLDQLKKTKVDQLLVDQINRGKVYIGESSGIIVLTNDISYVQGLAGPEVVDLPATFEGLNIIDFNPIPHYQTYPFEEAVEKILDQYGETLTLLPITNNEAILVNGDQKQVRTIV